MSHIKSAPQSPSEPFKWRSQARQLQEAFPALSNDDVQSLLVEVGGDVELAGTRITDGSYEQWGSVVRKKDKKHPSAHSVQPAKEFSAGRGDFRGGRGGRSGRGGSGRGGAGGRGRGGPANRSAVNGHTSRTGTPRPTAGPNLDAPSSGEQPEKTDIQDAWSAPPLTDKSKDGNWTEQLDTLGSAPPESTPAVSWNTEAGTNGFTPQLHLVSKQPTKTPATSKLSWAQVARPQEKPILSAPSYPPAPPSQIPTSVLLAPPSISPSLSAAEQLQQVGWEEPTTVEAPIWEDEPVKPSVSNPDGWNAVEKPVEESQDQSLPEQTEKVAEDTTQDPSIQGETDSAFPKESESHPIASAQPPPPSIPAIAVTPSPKLAGRPAVAAHRASARHKISDQPVVMPNSFGANIEKIGMQFGSLSLGGDSLDNNITEPDVSSTIAPVSVPETTPNPPAPAPKQEEPPTPQPPAAAPPASSTSLNSVFQQSQAVSQTSQPSHPSTTQSSTSHHLPTSVSQPAQVQTATHSVSTISTHQQNTTPHTSHISNHHQQQHPSALPQQTQQGHNLHHYAQHSLSAHHDSQALSPLHQQPQSASTHSTYFRQTDNAAASPYFHTPTPPSAQAQDNYSSFGQLAGQGHNQQGPHLGSFGPTDYGYSDSQRSFYESYNQQSGFGNRNVLGHDDLKTLPGAQQQPPSSGLSPSAGQASQQHTSQGNQQSGGGQAPQQGYPPPPVPYYYTHPYPQNQFYGPPYNSGYGVPQPFVKYPTMFQPGPAGPGSAPSPAGKQSGSNVGLGVQPQNNPYNQGLYQPGSYDDYQHHTSHQQQQHQHSHSLGLAQGVGAGGDYGKPLYGSGQGGMQAFMGLGQTGAGTGAPSSGAGGPRGNSSPETYKPYAPKDVGVGVGGRGGVQQGQGQIQGQPQGQGQGQNTQGPQGQGFYGANRFGASVGGSGVGVGGAPQNALHQQGPQAHLGYPQGAGDAGFYTYPGRQQQYWP